MIYDIISTADFLKATGVESRSDEALKLQELITMVTDRSFKRALSNRFRFAPKDLANLKDYRKLII